MKSFADILSEKLETKDSQVEDQQDYPKDNSMYYATHSPFEVFTASFPSPAQCSTIHFKQPQFFRSYASEACKFHTKPDHSKKETPHQPDNGSASADTGDFKQKNSNKQQRKPTSHSVNKDSKTATNNTDNLKNSKNIIIKLKTRSLSKKNKAHYNRLNQLSGYELPEAFSSAELKKVYKRLVFKFHPDRALSQKLKKTPESASFNFNCTVNAYKALIVLFATNK
ncbi:MAG: hypothetical protein HOO06_11945 [Bdellovibrionaceae bacterium]|jgi:hypothetical protein|nr:hypothetical protein [Pseudobdellovibrionaceae bacterium]